jgi:uncharacterized protein (TIGR02996 family)
MAAIDQAVLSFEAGDPCGALASALAAWRDTRHPAVRAAALALAPKAIAQFPAPTARNSEGFQAAWMQVAATDPSPVATAWLASTFETRLPLADDRYGMLRVGWMLEKHAPLHARGRALEARCPDPLVGAAAHALFAAARYGFWDLGSTRQIYAPIVDLAVKSQDPGLGEELRALAEAPTARRSNVREYFAEALRTAADQLATLRPARVDPEEIRRWEQITDAPAAPPPAIDVAPLFEAVHADPRDVAARAILADALQEIGDPRGEFIALQLGDDAGPYDLPRARRARQLLRAGQTGWMGADLAAISVKPVFRAGFLDRFELAQNAAASPEVWLRASSDGRLATVRRLDQGRGNKEHYARFVLSPEMRDLRRISVPVAAFLDDLLAGPVRAIEELEFPRAPNRKILQQLAATDRLPALRLLAFPTTSPLAPFLADLRKTGLHTRIRAFESFSTFSWTSVNAPREDVLSQLPRLIEALPAFEELRIAPSGNTDLRLVRVGDRWAADFTDAHGYVFASLTPKLPKLVSARLTLSDEAFQSGGAELASRIAATWECPVDLRGGA